MLAWVVMVDISSMKTTVIEYYPPDYSVESPILILAAPDEALVGPLGVEVVFLNQSSQGQASIVSTSMRSSSSASKLKYGGTVL